MKLRASFLEESFLLSNNLKRRIVFSISGFMCEAVIRMRRMWFGNQVDGKRE